MNMDDLSRAFTPFHLGGLKLKNRFIKTATYEGMYQRGFPKPELTEHHAAIARGDVAMTTVAYGAVNPEALTTPEQMVLTEEVSPSLKELTSRIHDEGGAVGIQLTHCGFFTKNTALKRRRPLAPSMTLNAYGALSGLVFSRAMTKQELDATRNDFARAAGIAKASGFDALEIHMGHGYLLSQFLSPAINKRKDGYGGSLENRLRFPLEVVEAVRKAVGDEFPVLCKMNLSDDFRGGLMIDEAVSIARHMEKASVSALVLSGGYTSKTPFFLMRGDVPLWKMARAEKSIPQKLAMGLFGSLIIRKYDFTENFFLPMALKVRDAVSMPLVYLGGVVSSRGVAEVMGRGFDLVAIGRALLHDPEFIMKIRNDGGYLSPCNHCNDCVAEMDINGVRCTLDPAP